ncbi:MAG: DUF4270 family protein [Bacteroidales bacterium]|nr:DUF4270 family protein [Bacteroidales bacterium]
MNGLSIFKRNIFLQLSIFLAFISCNSSDDDFYIGKDFIESKSAVVLCDSFSLNISTVMLDSFITSGTETALCGSYADSLFGFVSSRSYFELGLPEINLDEEDIYDSTVLILKYTGYSYGDTNKINSIKVFPLLENLDPDADGNCYNINKTECRTGLIGEKAFCPMPNSIDSVSIRIGDDFGKELWQLVVDNSELFSSQETFRAYLPGICIAPDENNPSAIIGFKAGAGEIFLRIFSHRYGETVEAVYTDFLLTSSELQYNNIVTDFNGTPLQLLQSQKEDISSSLTGNCSYLQGVTGLLTKISIPYFHNFLLSENTRLLRAEIVLRPHNYSYLEFKLPQNLAILTLDKYNRVESAFYTSDGNLITASYVSDDLYHDNAYYAFDITSYMLDEISDAYFDSERSIAVALHPDYLYTTFERLILERSNMFPVLRIIYLAY